MVANGKTGEFGKTVPVGVTVAKDDRLELVIKRNVEYTCDTTGVEFTITAKDQTWNFSADWLAKPPGRRCENRRVVGGGIWRSQDLRGPNRQRGAGRRRARAAHRRVSTM